MGIPLYVTLRFPRLPLCGYSIDIRLVGDIDKQHPGKVLLGSILGAELAGSTPAVKT